MKIKNIIKKVLLGLLIVFVLGIIFALIYEYPISGYGQNGLSAAFIIFAPMFLFTWVPSFDNNIILFYLTLFGGFIIECAYFYLIGHLTILFYRKIKNKTSTSK